MTQQEIEAIRDNYLAAANLADELHTERLNYNEYMTLLNCIGDIPLLLDEVERLEKDKNRISSDYIMQKETIVKQNAEIAMLTKELELAKAERDAALDDISQSCKTCLHSKKLTCPWEGTYHHKGEHGEKIGVCNAWKWRGVKSKEDLQG